MVFWQPAWRPPGARAPRPRRPCHDGGRRQGRGWATPDVLDYVWPLAARPGIWSGPGKLRWEVESPDSEGLGLRYAPERWCRTRHLPEQKLRSLVRQAQNVRPQLQQATIFLITPMSCGLHSQAVHLLEKSLLSRGGQGRAERWFASLLPPSAETGVEGLGHGCRGAGATGNAGVGSAVAGPALDGCHDRDPRIRS